MYRCPARPSAGSPSYSPDEVPVYRGQCVLPELVSGEITESGDQALLEFNMDVAADVVPAGWSMEADGVDVTLTAAVLEQNVITVDLAAPVSGDAIVEVDYDATVGSLRSTGGLAVRSITGFRLTNNSLL